ncbi:MAG: hypothetical protein COB38_07465 [Gammaproteobacteria bacterium]|nr:MAG: hypothetical protein COB38_07465 [Gammaproteobacteria bacterium]
MDWQIRLSLIIFGIALVAYIYFDYSKKKKVEKKNDQLKKQFSQISISIDSAGFDSSGVGKARSKSQLEHNDSPDKIEPQIGDIEIVEDSPKEFESSKKALGKIDIKSQPDIKKIEEKVYSLIIQAPKNHLYKGSDLMPLFLSQGLKFGEMNIFHRYEHMGKNRGEVIVSLANAVEPGTFNLEKIESFTTPALAIFSTFSGSAEYINHYKNLVKTAEFLVKELSGKILDKSGNVYTQEMHKERLQEISSAID